jgi:hypothetical protein
MPSSPSSERPIRPSAAFSFVGHNPGLHETARLLIAAGDVEIRERLNEGLPTAGLALIDFPVDVGVSSSRTAPGVRQPALASGKESQVFWAEAHSRTYAVAGQT